MIFLVVFTWCMVLTSESTVLQTDATEAWNDFLRDYLLRVSQQCVVPPFDLVPRSLLQRIQRRTVYIHFYTRTSTSRQFFKPSKVYPIQDIDLLLINPAFNAERQTVIYIHGWRNHPSDESTKSIVQALVLKTSCNVLLMDTSKYMYDPYITSTTHVYILGKLLNELIVTLIKRTTIDKINLIGFSLGAHVSGIAGMLFQNQTGEKLERITGLDPAKPCFVKESKFRLSKEAAKYVEVIHTNSGTLGLEEPLGHVDLYVNGLVESQPDCADKLGVSLLVCNHGLSWKLFVSSIDEIGVLKATQCKSWDELKMFRCSGKKAAVGYGSRNNSGLFYLNTDTLLSRNRRYSERKQRHRIFKLIDMLFS